MDCHKCEHHGEVPGSAHLCCEHPKSGLKDANSADRLMAVFKGVGRVAPVRGHVGVAALGIELDPRAILSGWALWPFNFDPLWVRKCNGYKEIEERSGG